MTDRETFQEECQVFPHCHLEVGHAGWCQRIADDQPENESDPSMSLDPALCADGCGRPADRERQMSDGHIEFVCEPHATQEAK